MITIRQNTAKALTDIGYSMNNNGFLYIQDAVELMDFDDSYTTNIMGIYVAVATRRCATAERVRRAIRYAFEWILTHGQLEYVEKYLGSTEKRANKELLVLLYQNVKEIK